MSAFVVSDAHVNALLAYGLRVSRHFACCDLDAMGQMLLDANYARVDRLYGGPSEKAPRFKFKEQGSKILSPVEAIKAVQCLMYQSNDAQYPGSEAEKLAKELMRLAIEKLPGYGAAAWEIQD